MKKNYKRIICFLILLILVGCGQKQKKYDDTYVKETDFPFMNFDLLRGLSFTESEEGFYYLVGEYIFYADFESMKTTPLCNKVECDHFDEADTGFAYYCNAYVGADRIIRPFIQFYDGNLYVGGSEDGNYEGSDKCFLMKISADGSEREVIRNISDGNTLMIHRGYIYITNYNAKESFVTKIPIDKPESEGEVIFTSEGLDSPLCSFTAYGNHIYIQNWGANSEKKSFEVRNYSYDIIEEKVTQILEQEGNVSIYCNNKNKIMFTRDYEKFPEDYKKVYECESNGENIQVLKDFEEHDFGKFLIRLHFDGTYYYQEYVNYLLNDEEQKDRKLVVYNDKFEKIAEGSLDFASTNFALIMGNEEYLIISYWDEESRDNFAYVRKDDFVEGQINWKMLNSVTFRKSHPGLFFPAK